MRSWLMIVLLIGVWGCQRDDSAPSTGAASTSGTAKSGVDLPLAPATGELIKQATSLIEKQDLDGALALLNQAVAAEPLHPEVYFRRGGVFADKGDDTAASADYNRAIELAPQVPRYWNTRGFYRLSRGKHQEALADFQKAIEIDPQYKQAHNNHGLVYIAQRKFDEAIFSLKNALAIDPKYTDAGNNLGYALLQKGLMFKALEQFDQVIELDPNYVNAYNNRGLVKHRLMKHDEAVSDFTEAIVRDPENVKFYHQRRDAYLALQMMDEARRDDSKVRWLIGLGEHHQQVRAKRGDPAVYMSRAEYYEASDMHQEAIHDLTHALSLDEQNAKALLQRGNVWMKLKQFDKAIADCTRAIEIQPLDEAYSIRGDAHLQKGEIDQAVADYEQARRFDADVAQAFWLRAEQREKSGEVAAASEDRNRAREIDPTLAEQAAE